MQLMGIGDEAGSSLASQIQATKTSKLSSMPENLLDPLSLEEVADLFAYLQKSNSTPSLTRRPIAEPTQK